MWTNDVRCVVLNSRLLGDGRLQAAEQERVHSGYRGSQRRLQGVGNAGGEGAVQPRARLCHPRRAGGLVLREQYSSDGSQQ